MLSRKPAIIGSFGSSENCSVYERSGLETLQSPATPRRFSPCLGTVSRGIRLCRKTLSGFERPFFRRAASGSIDDTTNIACFAVFARRKNCSLSGRRPSFPTKPGAPLDLENVVPFPRYGPIMIVGNRSRGMGLRSNGKGGLNRRILNKEPQNVEGQGV